MSKPMGPIPAGYAADEGGNARGIDAERLGPSAHPHARALDLEIRIDPHREPRPIPQLGGDGEGAFDLAFGFGVERGPGLDRVGEIGVALAGSGEADRVSLAAGHQREVQFPGGSDVEAVDPASNKTKQWLVAICFYSIM